MLKRSSPKQSKQSTVTTRSPSLPRTTWQHLRYILYHNSYIQSPPAFLLVHLLIAIAFVFNSRYSDRYKMTKLLLDEVFSTLRAAQRNISDVDLAALPPFPLHNQSILHDLTVVWEKTALLGDLTLRLPDLVRNQHSNRAVLVQQQSSNRAVTALYCRLRCLPFLLFSVPFCLLASPSPMLQQTLPLPPSFLPPLLLHLFPLSYPSLHIFIYTHLP